MMVTPFPKEPTTTSDSQTVTTHLQALHVTRTTQNLNPSLIIRDDPYTPGPLSRLLAHSAPGSARPGPALRSCLAARRAFDLLR
jgi:hypothetical protein